jgi:hypothetical protein
MKTTKHEIENLIAALEAWVAKNAKRGLRNLPSTKRVMPETIIRIRQLRGILEARSLAAN